MLRCTGARVFCLVRDRDGSGALARVRDSLRRFDLWKPEYTRRITPVAGDLGRPLLGLKPEDFARLAEVVDLVVHAGATVNLVYPYSALEPTNVEGTREVLRLCCEGRPKPLHHVSTNGIFPPDYGLCAEDSDLSTLPPNLEDGYGRSKWAAETLIRRASERGLPVCIYRPGNVSGHAESGAYNPDDFLTSLLSASLNLGAAPVTRNGRAWRVEATPIDFVVRAIREISSLPDSCGGTFHLANPAPPKASDLFEDLEAVGYPLERLDFDEWRERLAASKANQRVSAVLDGLPDSANPLDDGNSYSDHNARHVLAASGARRLDLTASLLVTCARLNPKPPESF